MEQNRIFDIIINLLIGIKNHDCLTETTDSGEVLTVTQCKYLLNQTIRQYQIPKDHYFVSEAALELWQKIRQDSIFNYTYRDKVVKTIHEPVWIDKYNGSRKKPYQSLYLNCGESFTYNSAIPRTGNQPRPKHRLPADIPHSRKFNSVYARRTPIHIVTSSFCTISK